MGMPRFHSTVVYLSITKLTQYRFGLPIPNAADVLGPELIFVTGLVIFVTAVARLVCPDLLG